MLLKEINGKTIHVDEEGFMTDPSEWDRDIAVAQAKEVGIELTDAHWKVIEWCRQAAAESGKSPTLRQITSGVGITTKELFKLFPKG
ncbi:MAG: TusE/DsrC/DsvC family sulfur relay protein, partial [Caldilineae bacterium]